MRILGVIPARYASTRFPGKLLKEIGEVNHQDGLWAVPKDQKSYSGRSCDRQWIGFWPCAKFWWWGDYDIRVTSKWNRPLCRGGQKLHGNTDFDFLVNIQGDEPLIDPETIDSLCSQLDIDTQILTAYKTIKTLDELLNPNLVKVVLGEKIRHYISVGHQFLILEVLKLIIG